MERKCSQHPDRAARFVCDACHRLLCQDCTGSAGKLVLCSVCGELALPLEDPPATAAAATSGGAALFQASVGSFAEALTYPLRSPQAWVGFFYAAVLAAMQGAMVIVPQLGCLFIVPSLLAGLALPGIVGDVLRSTMNGEDALPEIPRYGDVAHRVRELLAYWAAGLVAMIPLLTILVLGILWFDWPSIAGSDPLAWPVLAAAAFLGSALWLAALAGTVAVAAPLRALRLDLHWRAVLAFGTEGVRAAAIAAIFPIALGAMQRLAEGGTLPVLIASAKPFVMVYAAMVTARLAGLLMFRSPEIFNRLYAATPIKIRTVR